MVIIYSLLKAATCHFWVHLSLLRAGSSSISAFSAFNSTVSPSLFVIAGSSLFMMKTSHLLRSLQDAGFNAASAETVAIWKLGIMVLMTL